MLPVLLHLGPINIYSFGVFLFLGVLLGMFVAWKKAAEYHFEDDTFLDIALGSLFWGVVGARLSFIVTHFDTFGWQPLRWLWITHYAGLSLWGGVIFGAAALWWLTRTLGKPLWESLDLATLGVALGISISRIGSLLTETTRPYIWAIESVLFLIIYYFLWKWEHTYRTFGWYRGNRNAAKPGFLLFSGPLMSGVVWLLLGAFRNEIRFIFVTPTMIEGLVALIIGSLGLYLRSGRKLQIRPGHN